MNIKDILAVPFKLKHKKTLTEVAFIYVIVRDLKWGSIEDAQYLIKKGIEQKLLKREEKNEIDNIKCLFNYKTLEINTKQDFELDDLNPVNCLLGFKKPSNKFEKTVNKLMVYQNMDKKEAVAHINTRQYETDLSTDEILNKILYKYNFE